MAEKPKRKDFVATKTKGKKPGRPPKVSLEKEETIQDQGSPQKKLKATKNVHLDTHKERQEKLKGILLTKRDVIIKEIRDRLGQSLTDEQQRRLESAMDTGDQALVDLEREMGISLQEMRNRERQSIEEALVSLKEGSYGICAECEEEISEKRLEALPFARLCVQCQSKRELMEKIERAEQRL